MPVWGRVFERILLPISKQIKIKRQKPRKEERLRMSEDTFPRAGNPNFMNQAG